MANIVDTTVAMIKANNDLRTIEHELKLPDEEIVRDVVCFHCQQAVEKYLKAFLSYHKIEIKKTHNIEFLLTQCKNIDKDFDNIEIRELSNFGIDIRYPDDFYIPEMEEIKFYYALAIKIKELICKKLEIKETI